MGNNQYNNFKQGIKNDVQSAALGIFAGIGLYLLVITLAVVFLWFFYKGNHYSIETKIIVGTGLLIFVIGMFTNRRFGNLVYRCWLGLLIGIFILLCLGVIGLIFYALYQTAFKDFF